MARYCPVCEVPLLPPRQLCPACARSYDRALAKDGTTMGVIEWAARRAKKLLRRRARCR